MAGLSATSIEKYATRETLGLPVIGLRLLKEELPLAEQRLNVGFGRSLGF